MTNPTINVHPSKLISQEGGREAVTKALRVFRQECPVLAKWFDATLEDGLGFWKTRIAIEDGEDVVPVEVPCAQVPHIPDLEDLITAIRLTHCLTYLVQEVNLATFVDDLHMKLITQLACRCRKVESERDELADKLSGFTSRNTDFAENE